MHPIIHPRTSSSRQRPADTESTVFRKPIYDCQVAPGALRLVVYVPGVVASGVSIEARGPDLVVTARKTRFVRVNWQAAHLEGAQSDYRLSLRLGRGLVYAAMKAEVHQGVLTVTLPKRAIPAAATGRAWPASAAGFGGRASRAVGNAA
jgi:HSP20 family protein